MIRGRRSDHRRGLSLTEVVVSLAILATATAAGLQAFGSFAIGSRIRCEQSTALELANQLMAEIQVLPFADPGGSQSLGVEPGEDAADRSTFDDIDDFDGWTEGEIRDRSNAVVAGYAGYTREVEVKFVNPLGETFALVFPEGLFKCITVKVSKGGRELARLVTIRGAHRASN